VAALALGRPQHIIHSLLTYTGILLLTFHASSTRSSLTQAFTSLHAPYMTCMYPPPHTLMFLRHLLFLTCMYPPPYMTCMYPPPHMPCMYPPLKHMNHSLLTIENTFYREHILCILLFNTSTTRSSLTGEL